MIQQPCFRTCLLGGLLLLGVSHAPAQPNPDAAIVRVGEVKSEEVGERRGVIGHLEPARRSSLAAEVAGRVVQAPPEPGVTVEKGQVVARSDDTLLKLDRAAAAAAVEEAQALIAERTADLEVSERDLARLKELRETDVARKAEVEDAASEVAASRARLELAQAALRRTESLLGAFDEQLGKTQIKAPFDAHVVRKTTELGQWLDVGEVVCELVEISRVKARLNVPQDLLPHVQPDQPIPLTIDALNQTRDVQLFSIVPDADPQSRTFAILVKIDNADGALKPGMSVSAQLPSGRPGKALTVPRDAVVSGPTGPVVYAHREGIAQVVPVRVRFAHGGRLVVDADLRDGEQVVIEGNERLRPGQPLTVQGEKQAGAGG